MEADTLGSGCRVSSTGMEYTDGQMEVYIKDNSNKIILKVMHIAGGQMALSIKDNTNKTKEKAVHITGMQLALSIMDSSRMIRTTETDFSKTMASYTESNMKKASL